MNSKMSHAPVFYTVAQVKFNPIAQMSDYVPPLQERLRKSGFPDFRAENQIELTFRRMDELEPDVQSQKNMRWLFTDAQRTEGYILFSSALVFHTTAYNVFSDFLEKTLNGIKLVHEIVELAYIERIGLRYLDAVVPTESETLQNYLNPSLMGLSMTLDGNLRHSFTETVTDVEGGTSVTRAMITDGLLALPPDLASLKLQLNINPRFEEIKGLHTVLDTDYFINKRNTFNIQEIKNQLLISHKIIDTAFKASATDYAREKWA